VCEKAMCSLASPKRLKTMDALLEQRNYLWNHFQFNADQRLKAFNFFVILSIFADGGIFSVAGKGNSQLAFIIIGGFVMALSLAFFLIDMRSKELLNLAIPGLKDYEQKLPEYARLFTIDARKNKWSPRYTIAFRAIFGLQFVFGLGVMYLGISPKLC
jgi:hypothetical protein